SGPVRRERETPDAMIELLAWPFAAGLVLTAMHAWFGLHVLARGVIFVDLALAQVAALGITVAILYGHPVQSEAAYWYALAFAGGGAVLFALARPYEASMRQEAVIGIVYAVSAALGVLALDRAPQGAEHIKQLLIGSILTVTPQEVGALAALYGLTGAAHWVLRRPLIEVSFDPLLAGFPGMDQPWLDALENAAPAVQEAFLTQDERATRRDSVDSISAASAELARLRALEQDVRWGSKPMDAERQERLRQYLAGRSELLAGDQLVLKTLRAKARERQRYALGMPLLLLGAVGLVVLARKASSAAPRMPFGM